MRGAILAACLLLNVLDIAFVARAEDAPPAEEAQERKKEERDWGQIPPEEREVLRRQMREAWQHLSPEERAHIWQAYDAHKKEKQDKSGKEKEKDGEQDDAAQQLYKAHKAYWYSLSPEEREALRGKLRETLRQHGPHGSGQRATRNQGSKAKKGPQDDSITTNPNANPDANSNPNPNTNSNAISPTR
ncbi:MAG: hypothetical protein LBB55_06250 [Zoogloeaceae bacterium]|nr:hypothetical protein [Zoogloeaceae bacterium]